jgi:hypothetical protein
MRRTLAVIISSVGEISQTENKSVKGKAMILCDQGMIRRVFVMDATTRHQRATLRRHPEGCIDLWRLRHPYPEDNLTGG